MQNTYSRQVPSSYAPSSYTPNGAMTGRAGHLLGMAIVVIAVVAGIGLVGFLYTWDGNARAHAAEAASSRAAPPAAAAAPAPATSGTSATAPVAASAGGSAVAGTAPSAPAATASLQSGQTAYGQFCQACHPSGNKGFGPALKGEAFQQKYAADDALTSVIRQGKGAMPGLSSAQMDDASLAGLVAYIRSIK